MSPTIPFHLRAPATPCDRSFPPQRSPSCLRAARLTTGSPIVHQLYRELHKAGVIHMDICTRHICLASPPDSDDSSDGEFKYRLIDFEGAWVPPPDYLHMGATAEQTRVQDLFYGQDIPGLPRWGPPQAYFGRRQVIPADD